MQSSILSFLIICLLSLHLHITSAQNQGCKFYPIGENRKFERIEENLPVGHEVFRVEVHPRSEFRLEAVDNSLSDINYFRFEEINNSTVAIKLAQSLEDLVDKRDPQSVLKFKLTCRGPAGTEDAFLPITIYIQDINDHKPEFQNVPYYVEVDELTPVGLTVFRGIHAIDKDKPNTANSDITYSIVGGNENNSFILSDPIEGILVVNKPLDYDHGIREFKIQIQASDHGVPTLSSVTTVTIKVKDADDQNPQFTREVYKASVSESPIITGLRIREKVVVQPSIHAYDQDTGINARLRYNIILGNENGFFEMNEQTAELYLVKEIDLEALANPVITLQIQATQVDNPLRQTLSRVDVTVLDINDNIPEFEYDMYNITVMENLPVGFTVLQVNAIDRDRNENAEFKYVINDETDTFQINENNGWISVKNSQKLDRETQSKFILHVSTIEKNPNIVLSDSNGRLKRNTQCTVEVNLLDSNDNNPNFYPSNHYSFNVLETAEEGTIVGNVYAHDKDLDLNGVVRYQKQISNREDEYIPFDIHYENGSVYVKKEFTALSRKAKQYTLFVIAEDQAPQLHERRSSVAVVKINVTDINNSVPEFQGAPYTASVGESLPEGTYVTQVQATDEDATDDVLTFSIVAGNDEKLFVIDSLTGKIFTSAVLDYEKKQSYDLLVQVSDGLNTAVTPLLINVIDINDQLPTFIKSFYNFTIEEEDPDLNKTIGQVQAQDMDSGRNAQIKYQIVDSYASEAFSIDSATGVIRARRMFDREQEAEISFKVMATDSGTPQLSSTCEVKIYIKDINDNAVVFPQNIYTVEIDEEKPAPLDVIRLQAYDNDQNENAIIKYLILAGNEDDVFQINENTGLVTTKKKLNYEQKQEYVMHIAARNIRPFEGPNHENMINPAIQLIVKVIDINDELVVFDQQIYKFIVMENTALNTFIGKVNATNPKRQANEQDVIYWLEDNQVSLHKDVPTIDNQQLNKQQLINNDEKRKFKINRTTGEIYLIGSLDRDYPANEQFFRFRVFSRDLSSINTFNTSASIEIVVVDMNDNVPIFNNDHYTLELPESLPPGTRFPAFFKVNDLDEGNNGKITKFLLHYLDNVNDTKANLDDLVNGESLHNSDIFKINNATGTITLTGTLDFETKNKHELLLIAFDGGQPANIGQARVTIQVTNQNEYPPKFLNLPYIFTVQERAKVGTEVGKIIAVDDDFNKIYFSISSASNTKPTNGQIDDVDYFKIDEFSGKITVREQLPEKTEFTFVAKATDDGLPQNYSLGVQVIVRMTDLNDFAPAFTSTAYSASIIEKQENDKTIIQVNAIDQDLQDNLVSYSIVSGNEDKIFNINEQTGEITLVPGAGSKVDYDRKNQYVLLIKATDSSPTPLYSLTMVKITVIDTNDHPPSFVRKAYSSQIAENLPANHCFLTAQATSGDSVDEVTYSLISSQNLLGSNLNSQNIQNHNLFESDVVYGKNKKRKIVNNVFSINEKTGQICTKIPLDREQKESYEFLIAADDGKFKSVVPLTVQILDENDSPPVFEKSKYQLTLPLDTQPGTELIQLTATDADLANNADITYWIKNTHGLFEIDAKTGLIRLVSNLPHVNGNNNNLTYSMEVYAQDHGLIPNIGKALLTIKATSQTSHPPKFERFSYSVEVDENLSNIVIVQVQATNSMGAGRSKITYRIIKSSLPEYFSIDKHSGSIKLEKPLDYEQTKFLELSIEAKDEAIDSQFTTCVVQVRVRDANDNAPEILAMPSVLRIPESTLPLSEIIYQVTAVDLDSSYNNNNVINYEFQNPSAFFAISRMTGQIYANQSLTPLSENLIIIASDNGSPPLATIKEIKLIVYKDSIEQPTPIFSASQYTYDLENIVDPGNVILRVKAKIPNGNAVYYNVSSDPTGQFIIDPSTGAVTVLTKLDPESVNTNALSPFNKPSLNNLLSKNQIFSFIVNAYNREDPFYSSESSVVIKLVDSSVKCPKFPFSQYYATIEENSPPNTIVLEDLLIEDYRKFEKQQLTYQITEDNSNDNFYIDVFSEKFTSSSNQSVSPYANLINANSNKMSVSLKVKKSIDRDTMSKFLHGIYTLVVTASNVKCSTRTMIKVLILDTNDNLPVFTEQDYYVQIRENSPMNTVVTKVNATDKDQLDHNRLRYYIVDGNEKQMFTINENSGTISLLGIPDRELVNMYQLRLAAIDTANNTGFSTLTVEILDENDNNPTFLNETFIMNVTEGPSSVNTRLRLPVYDLDDGINRQMEVYIVDGNSNGEFRLDVDEGGPLLTIISELDREKYASNAFMNSFMQSNLFGKHGSFALHQVLIAAKDKGVPARVGKAQVNIIINDINDTPPKFEKDSYLEFLPEDTKPGTVVCEIKATDADSIEKTQLTYNFGKIAGNTNIPFKIDPVTGIVNVSRPLDISEAEQYNLQVEVFDGLWKSSTSLKIFVNEEETRNPRFGQTYYHFNVMENEANAFVGRVELKPRKSRINSLMQYVIVNVEMRNLFSINSNGELYTKKALDREKRSQYSFTVMLEEKRPSTKITIAEVIINITDANDETPMFNNNYKGSIKENSPPGTQVTLKPENIRAIDLDAGNNSVVHYTLSGEGSDYFTVLDSGSVLYTPKNEQQVLDREQKAKFDLIVTATDNGNLSSTTSLVITLDDENDNPPVFQHGPLFILIPEIAKPGSKVGNVYATDADDVGLNSKIQYYITSGSNGDIKIDRISGELFVVGNLVPTSNYLLNISAVDGGGLASRTSVNISVVDVNDHNPKFDQFSYQFDVAEGNYTQNKVKLGVLRARDEDYGKNGLVEYNFASSISVEFPFSIDVHTGELFASGFIDREHKDLYKFQIIAIDNGDSPLNSTTDVIIRIKDTNDNAPRFYTDPYLAHVPENLEAGFKVTQIAAFDSDLGENGQVFYKLGEGHDNKFYIDGKDGTVWTLGPLDFETKSFYNISVIAYDKGQPSLSSSAKLWVTVSDVPDNVPDFPKAVYTIEVAENALIDQTVYSVYAGIGAKRYILLQEDNKVIENNYEQGKAATFAIDQSTGELKLKKQLDSTQKNHYKLIVRAEDDSEPPKSDTAEINVFIGTGQGVRLFSERIYKVSIYENQLAPSLLIDLNSTNEIIHRPVYYSLIGTNYDDLFKIEHDTGRLIVTRSLDREQKSNYKLKVRENYVNERHKRAIPNINEKYVNSFNEHLAFDEALVLVDILDENDSYPKFTNGNPIVSAVPLEASFGYIVCKVTATDNDIAENSMIKYEMISKNDDSSSKFYVDPTTGNIRSIVNFAMDANKYYHFEVKATDRNGDPNGNSALISVYIYVLPETKMVLFVTDAEPVKIENRRDEILKYLSRLTKYDVKLAKITPHLEQGVQQFHSTDMYLYAVNPRTNEIVDIDQLLNIFRESSHQILDQLKDYRIRRIQGVTVHEKISQMGTTEIAIIGLSTVIFLGTIIAILLLCSSCKERKLRKEQMQYEHQRLFQVKNAFMEKQPVPVNNNLYGNRDLSNGNSNCTYSTEDGNGSEYFNNLAQFKRNDLISKASRLEGRPTIPPDGASSLNQSRSPRSPRFSDRYKHRFVDSGPIVNPQQAGEWFDQKEPVPSIMSRHSRASGRSVNSGTSWSGSSEERNFATEL